MRWFGFLYFCSELDDLLEELQPKQSRFPSLPGKHHFLAILSFDVLLDMSFGDFVGNLKLAGTAPQVFLVQVITVGPVEIKDCAHGFDHRMVGTGTDGRGPR